MPKQRALNFRRVSHMTLRNQDNISILDNINGYGLLQCLDTSEQTYSMIPGILNHMMGPDIVSSIDFSVTVSSNMTARNPFFLMRCTARNDEHMHVVVHVNL